MRGRGFALLPAGASGGVIPFFGMPDRFSEAKSGRMRQAFSAYRSGVTHILCNFRMKRYILSALFLVCLHVCGAYGSEAPRTSTDANLFGHGVYRETR